MSRGWRLILMAGFCLGGAAILLSLGFWQVGRMAEKRELIEAIEARASAEPIAVAGRETPERDDLRAARAVGRFLGEPPQLRFLTSVKGVGPGFHLIAPFELESGVRILVDRGFAPEAVAPRGGAAPEPPRGPQTLLGILRWPNEVSAFSPEPNMTDRIWFAREVDSMAEALGTEPVMLSLAAPPTAAGAHPLPKAWPAPVNETIDLPNNHLGYALTWFSLAAIWLAMSALWVFGSRGKPAEAAR